jgi:hypothetical protein
VGQGGVEPLDVVRGGPLLGAVHGRRATLSEQGVVDVAGHGDGDALHPAAQRSEVKPSQPGQGGTAVRKVIAGRVQQPCPKGGHHAGAAVGAGAAANADHDGRASRIDGRCNDLAEAPARGCERSALAARQADQPGHVGHLDHRGVEATCIRRLDRVSCRAGRDDRHADEPG